MIDKELSNLESIKLFDDCGGIYAAFEQGFRTKLLAKKEGKFYENMVRLEHAYRSFRIQEDNLIIDLGSF